MDSRTKKFLSYYKPYLGLLAADLLCAIVVSAVTLVLPLCVRYITKNLLTGHSPEALSQIYGMGHRHAGADHYSYGVQHVLLTIAGHMMGTLMESAMRRDSQQTCCTPYE